MTELFAQNHSHLIRVNLAGRTTGEIQATGIAFDHGRYIQGESFTGDFSHEELEKLKAHGFNYEPVNEHFFGQAPPPLPCKPENNPIPNYSTPANYAIGSMNGFLNLEELYENLDLMQELYPSLVTQRKAIGNIVTEEGRQIYYIKISDNPNTDESEPQILYTALHHAREPASMSQMLYFMWYLLENYDREPEIKKLVDGREMFFVACVNPDGYKFNQLTNPFGNGYWRKNRTENELGFGVDLNRNYSFEWGYNNLGSSDKGDSDIYRGDAPFSESETRAIRELCRSNHFNIAINYHSFGNYLIIPWAFTDLPTVDHKEYDILSKDFTRYNNFQVGNVVSTLNYQANGVAEDWMYGDTISKNKIFSFTPEIGYDFWPERSDISKINQSTQYMNFSAAWNAGAVATMNEVSNNAIEETQGTLLLKVQRTGIVGEDIHIYASSDHESNIELSDPQIFQLNLAESRLIEVHYKINGNIPLGEKIKFTFNLNTGEFSETIEATKQFLGKTYWKDQCTQLNYWSSPNGNSLMLTDEEKVSEPASFTDSPDSEIHEDKLYIIKTQRSIDLKNASYAFLSYYVKFDLHPEIDFAQVLISTDGIQFVPLCGQYSNIGGIFQGIDQPVYSGLQDQWVNEWIDLKDYLGKDVFLQIKVGTSVNDQPYDGFYIDDLKVYADLISESSDNNSNQAIASYNQHSRILSIHNVIDKTRSIKIINTQGKILSNQWSRVENTIFSNIELNSGIYILQIETEEGNSSSLKLLVP
ncbi:MAG: immune inhibitor A [Saprospiraceae bacterium]|nr:immune inhibitor A [Saprospiraceae bacterium]